jgi:hypothetical protein
MSASATALAAFLLGELRQHLINMLAASGVGDLVALRAKRGTAHGILQENIHRLVCPKTIPLGV